MVDDQVSPRLFLDAAVAGGRRDALGMGGRIDVGRAIPVGTQDNRVPLSAATATGPNLPSIHQTVAAMDAAVGPGDSRRVAATDAAVPARLLEGGGVDDVRRGRQSHRAASDAVP